MFTSQVATHVISALLHVASSYNSPEEPWNIDIEDHRGVVHSVDLQPGQVGVWSLWLLIVTSLYAMVVQYKLDSIFVAEVDCFADFVLH